MDSAARWEVSVLTEARTSVPWIRADFNRPSASEETLSNVGRMSAAAASITATALPVFSKRSSHPRRAIIGFTVGTMVWYGSSNPATMVLC